MIEIIKNWLAIGLGIAAFVGCFVEISKFKINPISFIFIRIGAAFNKPTLDKLLLQQKEMEEFNKKLEEISKKLEATDKKIDINEIKRIRAEIMAFAMSCKKREDHNEQQFQAIIDIHKEYELLIKLTGIENGVLDEDYNFIMNVYRHCRDSGKLYQDNQHKKAEEKV